MNVKTIVNVYIIVVIANAQIIEEVIVNVKIIVNIKTIVNVCIIEVITSVKIIEEVIVNVKIIVITVSNSQMTGWSL